MKKSVLGIMVFLFTSSIFAGEVSYEVGKHSKPPYPAFNYCDVVQRVMEPAYLKMNFEITKFNEDGLVGKTFAEFKRVVDSIPGIVLERTAGRTRHFKVLHVKVYDDKKATLHTTRNVIAQMDSGVAYKTKLRTLLTLYVNPHGFDDFIDDLGWKFMNGGCEIYQLNLNRLLPW